MIKNGMKVRDTLTGIEGIVVCRSEWLTGCVRITVQPKAIKADGDPVGTHTFDEAYGEVLSDKIFVPPIASTPAGPTPAPTLAAVR